jgi:hypothetical protein
MSDKFAAIEAARLARLNKGTKASNPRRGTVITTPPQRAKRATPHTPVVRRGNWTVVRVWPSGRAEIVEVDLDAIGADVRAGALRDRMSDADFDANVNYLPRLAPKESRETVPDLVKRQLEERRAAFARLRTAYVEQHPEAASAYEKERRRVLSKWRTKNG